MTFRCSSAFVLAILALAVSSNACGGSDALGNATPAEDAPDAGEHEPSDKDADSGSPSKDGGGRPDDGGTTPDGGTGAALLMSQGSSHGCASTTTGSVRCWGDNSYGRLGDGTTTRSKTAVDVVGLPGPVISLSVGISHSCAVTSTGAVYCWGDGNRLGQATTGHALVPLAVPTLTSGVVAVAAANFFTCVLKAAGTVMCWGDNSYHQIPGLAAQSTLVPVAIPGLTDVRQLTASGNHACALSNAGGVRCWGYNSRGQLGIGSHDDAAVPTQVVGLGSGVKSVQACTDFDTYGRTCAVMTAGSLKCWGANVYGEIGASTPDDADATTPLTAAGLSSVEEVACGFAHTCVRHTNGSVACFGAGSHGQLGLGDRDSITVPTEVDLPPVTQIRTGTFHSCARLASGRITCWGTNIGNSFTDAPNDRLLPQEVPNFP